MGVHAVSKSRTCNLCNENFIQTKAVEKSGSYQCSRCHRYGSILYRCIGSDYGNNREIVIQDKVNTGCEECGYGKGDLEKSPALTYDHLDPSDKMYSMDVLCNATTKNFLKTYEIERAKCRVLCANCHNIHTRNQKQEGKEKSLLEAVEHFANLQHRDLPPKIKLNLYLSINLEYEKLLEPLQMELDL